MPTTATPTRLQRSRLQLRRARHRQQRFRRARSGRPSRLCRRYDNDGNGYIDDLSGWDADDDDGDEFDHRYFGHGTGRAGIVGPETNNGRGVAGVCPDCPLMNVRIDDTFVCNSEAVAKGALYASTTGTGDQYVARLHDRVSLVTRRL